MARSVADYLIDPAGIVWATALAPWSWLVPPTVTVWLVSRFADLFLVLPDGTVHMLDAGAGTLTEVAKDREDFCTQIDEGDTADQWLMISLVDRLVTAGVVLRPGQCYGFKTPPVLGGDYTVENCGPLDIVDYLGAYGSIHEQLRDVPNGSEVTLRLVGDRAEGDALGRTAGDGDP